MKKVPISLIIDDPAPVVSVYHHHHKTGFTDDGRPVVATFPNAMLGTGLRILEEIARRIDTHLSDQVEWTSFAQILEMVTAHKASYPKPDFA